MQAPTPIRLFLFGAPRLERDGVALQVETRKAIALLAYLAVTGERHSRDTLATLLYPEYNQTRARATLRRTLSALNTALGHESLAVDRETIGFDDAAPLWTDVAEFRAALAQCHAHAHSSAETCADCAPLLARAVELYRDDLLAGFTLRDSPTFDDWQVFQTEHLRRELLHALEKLARYFGAHGNFTDALAHARRLIALDSLNEPAHQLLMQLYTWTGQRAAAMKQYQACARALQAELGVQPMPETTRLLEEIKTERSRDAEAPGHRDVSFFAPPRPRAPVPAPELHYPLIGRSAELAALLKAHESIRADGHWIILEGEAGIGKTRLAETFLAQAQAQGARVLATRCYEGEASLAYEPIVAALRAVFSAPAPAHIPPHYLTEATRLLPEVRMARPDLPPPLPLDTPGAQGRFFEGILQVLLATCNVFFIDDLQWADAASLDWLAYIVQRMRGRALCVLSAWRGEEIAPEHRIRQLLGKARRASHATLVPLARLDRAAVMDLVNSAGMGTHAQEIGERLYQETEGLPFFLVEYLAALTRDAAEKQWSLPRGARDLLHARLAGIGEASWQLLSAAASIGRAFDLDVLREASGRSEEEAIAGLEGLVARGLLKELPNVQYDFSHDKLRAVVGEETSPARRRILHRRVADALVHRARGRGEPEARANASRIAYHFQEAGQTAVAADYYKLAGEHARTLYANAEAVAHFQAALALGHPDTATLHEALGDLQTLLGEYAPALASYETAAALVGARARLEHKRGILRQRRGEWELAQAHFQAALAALNDSASDHARILADWSLAAHHSGKTDSARELAQKARALAESANDTRALAQAHNILGILAHSQSDLAQAREHLEYSVALAEQLGDSTIRAAALNNLALVCAARGETARALTLTQTALELVAAQGDRHHEAALRNNLADLLHAAGRAEEAMTHLKQAVAIFAEIGIEAGTWQPEIWKLVEW